MKKGRKLTLEFVSLADEQTNLNQIINCSGCDCNNNDYCNYDSEYLDEAFIEDAPAFTLGDFLDDIHLVPTDEQKKNIQRLASSILQPVFDHFHRPIIIKSAIHVNEEKKPLEGVQVDLHASGLAVDFNVKNVNLIDVMKYIEDNFNFHEMVLCNPGSKREHIHLSISPDGKDKRNLFVVEKSSRKSLKAELVS